MADGPDAPHPTWDLDDLRALLEPCRLLARDGRARTVAVPEVLTTHDAARAPTWNDQLAAIHPDDAARAVRGWWSAVRSPGRVVEVVARYRDVGRWTPRRVVLLDLRHQPAVGVVLVGIEDLPDVVPPVEVTAPLADLGPVASWSSPAWIHQRLDDLGTILGTEGHVEHLFGRTPEELVGTNVLDALHPDDHPAALSMWMALLDAPGQTRTIRQRLVRPDGSAVWIESMVTNRLEDDAHGALVATSQDISSRMDEEAALRASREELRTLAEEVPVAVFRADVDGRLTYGNVRWYRVLAELGPVERLEDLARPEDADDLRAALAAAADPAGPTQVAHELTAPDGRRFVLTWRRADADGLPEALLGVLTDVTDTVELRHRAEHDDLTGLLNRRGLEDRLAALLEAGTATVAFIDLDDFKVINDEQGHAAGDAVLAELGQRLGTLGDLVAGRWGGDEFVLVVDADHVAAVAGATATEAEVAAALRARVEAVLGQPLVVAGRQWTPAASVGIAVGHPGEAPSDVLRRADAGMYAEKRARRTG